jgi:hypothetical protein
MSPAPGVRDRSWGAVGVSLLSCGLLLALLSVIGADLLWLVALGDDVRTTGALPDEVPFAAAPSRGWPPVLVAAEVAISVIHELGLAGLLIWHFLAVLTALVIVVVDARRRGATDLAAALVLSVLVIGGVATFAVARLQTFSLIPFSLMLLLVRDQHRNPGRAMWWAPVLVAVWGNLHGSVLLGVCVIGAHLLFSRLARRPAETVALGLATLAALFVTPATWRTADYYVGVLQNEAAARGEGLWAAPALGEPFDLVMIVAAAVLGGLALRRGLPLWEYVALAGLTIATIIAARNGIWLLLFLAAPSASGGARSATEPVALGRPTTRAIAAVLAVVLACAGVLGLRTRSMTEASEGLAAEVRRAAPGLVVLAPEPVVESLTVHGVRVWLSNPLDAFSKGDQRAYLDFMAGRAGMMSAVDASEAVLVRADDPARDVMAELPGFEVHELEDSWLIYVRR